MILDSTWLSFLGLHVCYLNITVTCPKYPDKFIWDNCSFAVFTTFRYSVQSSSCAWGSVHFDVKADAETAMTFSELLTLSSANHQHSASGRTVWCAALSTKCIHGMNWRRSIKQRRHVVGIFITNWDRDITLGTFADGEIRLVKFYSWQAYWSLHCYNILYPYKMATTVNVVYRMASLSPHV